MLVISSVFAAVHLIAVQKRVQNAANGRRHHERPPCRAHEVDAPHRRNDCRVDGEKTAVADPAENGYRCEVETINYSALGDNSNQN